MKDTNLEFLNKLKIGILGCGHLGQAIALALVSHGLSKENLLLTYKDNPATYQRLETLGLKSCLTTNQRLFQESEIVFITIKPQDILQLTETVIPEKALIVSCMAGASIEQLSKVLKTKVYRIMFSGPDTILSGKGVAAIYPEQDYLAALLHAINITHIKTLSEADINVFTAGVCMPAALLKTEHPAEHEESIARLAVHYPLLFELYTWAVKVLPQFDSNMEKEAYVERMITKGGVTDAIVTSLAGGASLDIALRKGIIRTQEISSELNFQF